MGSSRVNFEKKRNEEKVKKKNPPGFSESALPAKKILPGHRLEPGG